MVEIVGCANFTFNLLNCFALLFCYAHTLHVTLLDAIHSHLPHFFTFCISLRLVARVFSLFSDFMCMSTSFESFHRLVWLGFECEKKTKRKIFLGCRCRVLLHSSFHNAQHTSSRKIRLMKKQHEQREPNREKTRKLHLSMSSRK